MYLQRLELRDFRRFGHIDVSFDPKLTVIAAINGEGKTTLLEAAAIALGPYVGAFPRGRSRHIIPDDARVVRPPHFPEGPDNRRFAIEPEDSGNFEEFQNFQSGLIEAYGVLEYDTAYPVVISATLGNPSIAWQRELRSAKGKTTVGSARPLSEYAADLQQRAKAGEAVTYPLIAWYSSRRLWVNHRDTVNKRLAIEEERTAGYEDCLSDASSFAQMSRWMKNATLYALQRQETPAGIALQQRLDGIAFAVYHAVKSMGFERFQYSLAHESLTLSHDDHGELAFDRLSDGIRAVASMVADMAFRATKLNPHLGGHACTKTPGIVLIDEIDLHLHPRWQREILASLQKAMPLVQFIVSTHSPQVLATIPKSQIRVIGADPYADSTEGRWLAEIPERGAYGRSSSEALANVMDVPPTPSIEAIEDDIHAYEELVKAGKEDSPEAQNLRADLEQKGYELNENELLLWRVVARRRGAKP